MTEQFVPPLARTLPALVLEAAQRHAGRVFVEDGDIVVDYADLPARAFEVSRALIAHGIAAGDRIAIWAPNRAEWLLAALGIHCAGAVMVPINTRMKGLEAADILARHAALTAHQRRQLTAPLANGDLVQAAPLIGDKAGAHFDHDATRVAQDTGNHV